MRPWSGGSHTFTGTSFPWRRESRTPTLSRWTASSAAMTTWKAWCPSPPPRREGCTDGSILGPPGGSRRSSSLRTWAADSGEPVSGLCPPRGTGRSPRAKWRSERNPPPGHICVAGCGLPTVAGVPRRATRRRFRGILRGRASLYSAVRGGLVPTEALDRRRDDSGAWGGRPTSRHHGLVHDSGDPCVR